MIQIKWSMVNNGWDHKKTRSPLKLPLLFNALTSITKTLIIIQPCLATKLDYSFFLFARALSRELVIERA